MTLEIDLDYENDVRLSDDKMTRVRIQWADEDEDEYDFPPETASGIKNPVFLVGFRHVSQTHGQTDWGNPDAAEAYHKLRVDILIASETKQFVSGAVRALVEARGGTVETDRLGSYVAVVLPEFAAEWGMTEALAASLGDLRHYLDGQVYLGCVDRFDTEVWDWRLNDAGTPAVLYGRGAAEKWADETIAALNRGEQIGDDEDE